MQFNIQNNYNPDSSYHTSFQNFIDCLNDEDNQEDSRWENAKESIQYFVEQHQAGVKLQVRTTRNLFINETYTDLEKLGQLWYIAHTCWNFCLMSHEDYTKLAHRMYKESRPDIKEKVTPIIDLFAMWGWG